MSKFHFVVLLCALLGQVGHCESTDSRNPLDWVVTEIEQRATKSRVIYYAIPQGTYLFNDPKLLLEEWRPDGAPVFIIDSANALDSLRKAAELARLPTSVYFVQSSERPAPQNSPFLTVKNIQYRGAAPRLPNPYSLVPAKNPRRDADGYDLLVTLLMQCARSRRIKSVEISGYLTNEWTAAALELMIRLRDDPGTALRAPFFLNLKHLGNQGYGLGTSVAPMAFVSNWARLRQSMLATSSGRQAMENIFLSVRRFEAPTATPGGSPKLAEREKFPGGDAGVGLLAKVRMDNLRYWKNRVESYLTAGVQAGEDVAPLTVPGDPVDFAADIAWRFQIADNILLTEAVVLMKLEREMFALGSPLLAQAKKGHLVGVDEMRGNHQATEAKLATFNRLSRQFLALNDETERDPVIAKMVGGRPHYFLQRKLSEAGLLDVGGRLEPLFLKCPDLLLLIAHRLAPPYPPLSK